LNDLFVDVEDVEFCPSYGDYSMKTQMIQCFSPFVASQERHLTR